MTRTPKTSLTHPLPLPAVTTPGGGLIGMTMCPGKRQPLAVTGPWARDLAADLAAIAAFGATTLISLMDDAELVAAAVPHPVMAEATAGLGLRWLQWPIVDFAAPDAAFETLWKREAGAVCRELSTGGRVVVHCRGGRGRSGLVAARLLTELGVAPAAAISAVRSAQPLAIETEAQEQHVRAYRPVLGLHALRA